MIRSGLCSKPDTDAYIVRMITGIGWHPDIERQRRPLREILLDDRGLLEDEIWRLFEVEGERRGNSLTSDGHAWAIELARLGDEGIISRDRLIDSTLDALERDFSEYNTRWFQAFHARLEPTVEELTARAHRYLRLLDNRIATTVSLALDALEAVEHHGAFEARDLAPRVAASLGSAPKKTALAALQLLGRAIERGPDAHAAGLAAATAALESRSVEVQRRALDLIAGYPDAIDATVRRELLRRAGAVAASQAARLEALIGIDLATVRDRSSEWSAGAVELERRAVRLPSAVRSAAGIDAALRAMRAAELPSAVRFSARELPVIHSATPLSPIKDHEELLELTTHLVESVDSPDEVERALDGVARLCGSQPAGFASAAKPLRKRALALVNSISANAPAPFRGGDPRGDLCGVAVAWLAPDAIGGGTQVGVERLASLLASGGGGRGPGALLSDRSLGVARSTLERAPCPLLATPTHAGSWIDPAALPGRLAAIEALGGTSLADAILAVLRLAPPAEEGPPPALREHSGELARALRTALGEPGLEPGPSQALWTAAAAVREVGALGDGGDERVTATAAAGYAVFADPMLESESVTASAADELERNHLSARWLTHPDDIRWVATVWPAWREPFYAAGAARQDQWAELTPTPDEGAFLEPLLDPDEPVLAAGMAVLMSAIAARDPARAGVAIDALIAAISDGRLDHEQLGRGLSRAVADGRSRVRMARALQTVASASVLTAECVRLALERSLAADKQGPTRDAHAFLAVLHELAADARAGVSDPSARAYLEGLSGRSKAAKLARELLALEAGPSRHARAAATCALKGRLPRGERWAAERPEPAAKAANEDLSTQGQLRKD